MTRRGKMNEEKVEKWVNGVLVTPPLIDIDHNDKESLQELVLQMLLDLHGMDVELKKNQKEKLEREIEAIKTEFTDEMPVSEYKAKNQEINDKGKEAHELGSAIKNVDPNLAIAKLPRATRLNKGTNEFLKRLCGIIPGLLIFIIGLTHSLVVSSWGGVIAGVLIGVLIGALGAAAAFEGFLSELYEKPSMFFNLPDPQKIAEAPHELNKLAQDWLTQVGLQRIEKAIERLGELAGKWDNKTAELQALCEQAESESNQDAVEKVQWHLKRLTSFKAKLQSRLQTLRVSRDHLLSLKTYDMKLFAIEAEIDMLGQEVELFLEQTTKLLRRIRDTVDMALTAEVQYIIEQDKDAEFAQLEELIRTQARQAASLSA